jgi:CRP/FNR family transcriptional regulator, cyclic AMP receptor protein
MVLVCASGRESFSDSSGRLSASSDAQQPRALAPEQPPFAVAIASPGVTGPQAATFLQSFSERERAELAAAGRDRRWLAAETLVRRGDRADSAIVLLAGRAKVHRLAADGTEVILGFLGPGDLLGEIAAIGGATRSATVTAIEPVSGIVIAISALRGFLAGHPEATLALLDLTLARLYVADARRVEFATADSLARVAARLVELAERFGVDRHQAGIEIELPINQEELASWSASSRESTARALRTLRDLGLIQTGRRRLTVINLDGLRQHTTQF